MTDQTLRWGIIGTGNIASRFASQVPTSKTNEVVAVGSRSIESANTFADKWDIANRHASYEDLLADDSVEAVYIATPHPMHVEWAIKAAEAGKHVLCEKPLAINRAWAEAMIEAAVRNDVFLMEAYMYRCLPQTKLITQLVRDGELGTVHQIQATFAFAAGYRPESRIFADDLAGGGILDVGGYPVSMARLIAGAATGRPYAEPAAVNAVGQVGETGADEWTVATLFFDGGITAQISTGVRLGDQNQVRIYGSKGYLQIDDPWFGGDGKPAHVTLYRAGEEPREISAEPALIYTAEAEAVQAAIASGAKEAPEMSWADTLGNLTVQDQWRAAIGQQYASERDDANIPTATGRPLAKRADAPMTYGHVPGVDKQVSRLVMGVDNQQTLPHAAVVFDDFVERGGTTFDTAYIYGGGRGEKLLGQWMKSRGNRDDVVVIGKGAHTPHCDPESITRQLHESLERLQTDHVDLYFMHRDNEEIPVSEFVDVLDEHFKAGRIKAFGGSNWSTGRFDEANAYAEANSKQPFTLLSNHLSLARAYDVPWAGCRHVADDESQAWLRERQVALFPWSSQARGFFTGRAKPEDTSDSELVRCFYSDENFRRLDRARELAAAKGVEPTAIALAWLLHQPYLVFPLIGPRHVSETRTSTPGLSVTLTAEEVAYLTA
ncbi:putative dehydrogenase/aryl-alcohol dehydrogenase-like putative oxidoreductase [Kribbella aluminosa]|uniref:Dehydrogenase/aryl-alcohol dehydrogenase-like putative oxidoreductase n=1 Tax=Kribbella aluminosa TaxID=416017 RepID=A0ABS4UI28_9ACTN|nr:aldo/keto reductase [Kribbella aluminosa]MBP2351221.1 putative dehydrogenase/aryl-alcohol dehydrogenase-like putative oxidoreductase [Kribbella aluminosa]